MTRDNYNILHSSTARMLMCTVAIKQRQNMSGKTIWKQSTLQKKQNWYYLKTINFIKLSVEFILFGKKSKNFFWIITHNLATCTWEIYPQLPLPLVFPGPCQLLLPLGLCTPCQTFAWLPPSYHCLSSKVPPPQRVLPWLSKLAHLFPDHSEQSSGFPLLLITLIYFLLTA